MVNKAEDFIAHHGVKGQKWGVTRAQETSGSAPHVSSKAADKAAAKAVKQVAKADKKWEKKAGSTSAYFKVYNAAAMKMNNTEINRINNDPRFKDINMNTAPKALVKKYYDEYSRTMTKALNEESVKQFGSSASGKKVVYDYNVDTDALPRWWIEDKDGKEQN